jgi:hypothetical protein
MPLNSENVNKWLTLLANTGVLIGIMFLAFEIRQSNRIAIASTEISIREQFKTTNELVLANDAVAVLLVKATDANAEFSDVEKEKLSSYLYAHINTWMGMEIAYANGMLTRATFETALDDVRGVLGVYPAMKPIAQEIMGLYTSFADSQVYDAIREVLEDID